MTTTVSGLLTVAGSQPSVRSAPEPPPVEAGIPPELTERETAVLRVLAKGLTVRQAATELHLSENTISRTSRAITLRLGADDIGQAILTARSRDLVSDQDITAQRPPRPGNRSLSQRHLGTLDCLSRGMTNQQISAELRVSLNIARRYVQEVMEEMGAHSRWQTVAYAAVDKLTNWPNPTGGQR
ncbi:LuxR C-terminal-related transcriptional regulator [Kitasatospora sp. NPDC002040]|uniref:response regulator transcription factor n=1 Tax=Kitasatospora sp. NPDC002040 TaxID=3154661 RepID=UPI00332F39C5